MEAVTTVVNCANITSLFLGLFVWFLVRCYSQYKEDFSFWSSRGVQGPTPLPFFGNYLTYMTNPIPFVDYKQGLKYGRVYGIYEGKLPVLMVWDPKIVEKIFISEHKLFKLQMGSPASDPLIANQVFFLEGEDLKRVRGIITSALTGSKLKQYFEQLEFDDLNKFLKTNLNKDINFSPMFDLHMLNVVTRHFYGLDLDLFNNPNHDIVAGVSGFGLTAAKFFLMRNFPSIAGFVNRKMGRTNEYLTSFISYAVEQRLEQLRKSGSDQVGKSKRDLLQTLVDANLSDVQLKANSIAMIKAGFGTTQTTLCYLSYELANNLGIQKRVQEEIDGVFEKVENEGRELNYDDLNCFPLLDACFTEVLRIHPVDFRTFRRSTEATKIPLMDIEVPSNQLIKVPLHSLQFDTEVFENSFSFKPERWLGTGLERSINCSFMAFGAGPRMCPGSKFAEFNSRLVMINILRKYTMKLSPKTRMDIAVGAFAAVPKDVWIKLIERR